MAEESVTLRNPILVILWTFGIYVVIYANQYLYLWIGSAITGASFDALASRSPDAPVLHLVRGGVAVVVGFPLAFLCVRHLWRRSPEWMGLGTSWTAPLQGLVAGLCLAAAPVGILAALGHVEITGFPSRFSSTDLCLSLLGVGMWSLFTGLLEELVFRGMATRELATRWGWPIGTAIGGCYFGAVHLISLAPLLTPILVLWILFAAILMSALFVALWLRSGTLWCPIAFHGAWNFCLAGVLGTVMSGKEGGFGLFEMRLNGPDVLTGGLFGIETSAVTLGLVVLSLVALLAAPCRTRGTVSLFRGSGDAGSDRE